jgi:WD40 repeat protein
VAVAKEAKRAFSAAADGSLAIWNYDEGTLISRFEGEAGRVICVAVTPKADRIVSGASDGTVGVWDVEGSGIPSPLLGHDREVLAVALTPDGHLAMSGSADGSLRVWNIDTRSFVNDLTGHTAAVRGVGLTHDGKRAVSCSADGTVRLWNLETYACEAELRGHKGRVLCVAMTPDGLRAVSGGADTTVRVWNLRTGDCVAVLKGHEKEVLGVALAYDGQRVASGSADGSVRIWDLGNHARTSRARVIDSKKSEPDHFATGVDNVELVTKDIGATNFILGLATYKPLIGRLPYHTHPVSEALIVLAGNLPIRVAGRLHPLGMLDAMQIPPHTDLRETSGNTAHLSWNASKDEPAVFLWSLSSEFLTRDPINDEQIEQYCAEVNTIPESSTYPELVTEFAKSHVEELKPGCHFRYYFSSNERTSGYCAGHARLEMRSSTPWFQNDYDTCIFVLRGRIECHAGELRSQLSPYQALFVPSGLPHALINNHNSDSEFVWVCPGD